MALAPLLAGWWLKQGAQIPAPAAGGANGDTLFGSSGAVMVEALIDGLWVDLASSGYVRYDQAVDISEGRSSEGEQADSSRCRFNLKNLEAMGFPFSGSNPESPFYGKFERGTPIRVSVPDGGNKSIRHRGIVAGLEERGDTSGNDNWVEVEAVGALDPLSRNANPIRSALYRDTVNPNDADIFNLRGLPVSYWPMEDGSKADFCAPAVGTQRMSFTGTPTLASFSGFDCSDPIPDMANSLFAGYVDSYTIDQSEDSASTVWFLLTADSALTNGTLLCRIVTGTTRWELLYGTSGSGTLNLRARDYEGTLIDETGDQSIDIVGVQQWVMIKLFENGSGVQGTLYTEIVGSDTRITHASANTSEAATPILYVQFNPLEVSDSFFVGHCTVYKHTQSGGIPTNTFNPGAFVLSAHATERADVRFARLCTEEGITHEVQPELTPHALAGLFQGVGQPMGPQKSGELMALLRECEAADGGIIYELTSEFGIGYRTLESLTNQTAQLELSQAAHQLDERPSPRRDTTYLTNEVTVQRKDGTEVTLQDTDGPLSVARAGRYPKALTLSLGADSQVTDRAGWEVHIGSNPAPRFREIAVQLANPNFTQGGPLRGQVLGVGSGDRFDVVDTPLRVSPDDVPLLALGRKERIDQFTHRIVWNTVPEKPYRVFELGLDGYDRLDAEDSRLQTDVTASATSLTVDSYDYTHWIRSSTHSSMFPFDVLINGERMTVTAITFPGEDNFGRTEASSWGSADIGGAWGTGGGTAADYNVTSGRGTHTLATANVSRRTFLQFGGMADLEAQVDIQTSALATGDFLSGSLAGRYVDSDNMYAARVAFNTDQTITLTIRRRLAASETQLVSYTTALTHAADTDVRLKFRVTGSLLQAKVWNPAATTEPTLWQAEATDTAISTSPLHGMRSISGSGNTNVNPVVRYDNYTLTTPTYEQIFTVTRGVNGVSRPHLAGSGVHIWDTVYIALEGGS